MRDHGDGASVSRGVPVCVLAVKPVPNYTAWWQRHMCVNNLPKVVTRQCPGAESNLRLWVTSGLQVQHVTVRLLSHTSALNSELHIKQKFIIILKSVKYVVICSITRFRNQVPGCMQLPGYPDLVSTLKQVKENDSEVTCTDTITQYFSTKLGFSYKNVRIICPWYQIYIVWQWKWLKLNLHCSTKFCHKGCK